MGGFQQAGQPGLVLVVLVHLGLVLRCTGGQARHAVPCCACCCGCIVLVSCWTCGACGTCSAAHGGSTSVQQCPAQHCHPQPLTNKMRLRVRDDPGSEWREVAVPRSVRALVLLNIQVRGG